MPKQDEVQSEATSAAIEVMNVNQEHKDSLSKLDMLALWITSRVGTMGFFFIIFLWTLIWLTWNLLAPKNLQFDPPAAFTFWLFISNMIQIFLMPLIMVGQNIQGKHAELRSESDYQVNLKSEKEVAEILTRLCRLESMIEEVLNQQKLSAGE